MSFVCRLLSTHTLSIQKLRQALKLVVIKHESLRTRLVLNEKNNQLTQQIIDFQDADNNLFNFIEETFETNEELDLILYDEKHNSHLFDLQRGLVFRCHVLHCSPIFSDDLLCDKDVIIFNFHHALFDFPSIDIFLRDISQAYSTEQLFIDDGTNLRYLDCE